MKYKNILLHGLQIQTQLKIFHWQAKEDEQRDFFRTISASFELKNEQLIQTIMKNLGKKIGVGDGQIIVKNLKNVDFETYLQDCAQFYQETLKFLEAEAGNGILSDSVIKDIIYDIINLFRRGLYSIRQQTRKKSGNLMEQMNKQNNQLIAELLKQYRRGKKLREKLLQQRYFDIKPGNFVKLDPHKVNFSHQVPAYTRMINKIINKTNNHCYVHSVENNVINIAQSRAEAVIVESVEVPKDWVLDVYK